MQVEKVLVKVVLNDIVKYFAIISKVSLAGMASFGTEF
jgi:hypothetical protein